MAVILSFCYFRIGKKLKLSDKNFGSILFCAFLSLFVGLISLIWIIFLLEENIILTKNKTKCPQYEKIDNVYKLIK